MKRLFVLIALLMVSHANAIDEDYDIPYTDTYGYVYDPDTGQFVRQEQVSEPVSSSVDGGVDDVTVAGYTDQDKSGNDTDKQVDAGKLPGSLFVGSGLVILLLIVIYLSRRQKSGTLS